MPGMACFERASPALKDILLKLYHAEKPVEIDHHLYEFGSVKYHIQFSSSDPHHTFLSISMPLLSQGAPLSGELPRHSAEMVKGSFSDVVEIIIPAREGYQLTLSIDFSKVPQGKASLKMITEISSVQSVILSSQLKEMFGSVSSKDQSQGMCKPIKLVYHPQKPFFVIKQPAKITAIFPMRFRENSDVMIATAFFQELVDVGNSETFSKAPPCTWSPIPPPELRGESFEDLSTNGGFVSFDISSRHVQGKRLDRTVWNLLNFYAFVEYHIKCTRGLIQRRMRKRLDCLVEVLEKAGIEEEDQYIKKVKGSRCVRKLFGFSKSKILGRRCNFIKQIKRIRSRIKIHGFTQFRHRWLTIPKFSSVTKYTKLD